MPFRVPGLAAIRAGRARGGGRPAHADGRARRGRPNVVAVLDHRSPDPMLPLPARDRPERPGRPDRNTPDTANRCAALAEAVPAVLRQQELVCLSTGHVNCPRYLRGAAVIAETPTPVVREGRAMSPAMLVSLVVLVLALSASVGFVLARGGPIAPAGVAASASPSSVAAASPSAASGAPVVAPTSSSSASSPHRSPSPTPSVTPSPTPSATPIPTAVPTRARRRGPTGIDSCRLARTRRAAGSTPSEAVTTCSASPATSACPRAASTRGTHGCAARAAVRPEACHRPRAEVRSEGADARRPSPVTQS